MDGSISDEQVMRNRRAMWEATDEFHAESVQEVEELVDEARTLLEEGKRYEDVYVELTSKTMLRNSFPGQDPPPTRLVGMLCEAAVRLARND